MVCSMKIGEAAMNGGPVQQAVTGAVIRFDCSGIGPNSGELTLVVQQANGEIVEVFAGIMDSNRSPDAVENGVYSSYANMALAALTTGRKLQIKYLSHDKPRINGMTILS